MSTKFASLTRVNNKTTPANNILKNALPYGRQIKNCVSSSHTLPPVMLPQRRGGGGMETEPGVELKTSK